MVLLSDCNISVWGRIEEGKRIGLCGREQAFTNAILSFKMTFQSANRVVKLQDLSVCVLCWPGGGMRVLRRLNQSETEMTIGI